MYVYDELDQQLVEERVLQFADQTCRYLASDLSEDEFRPLRLQNGLYIQKQAPMLRVAIPYGMVNAVQLRMLARIARRWDRSYAHFTTRQNVQFNWVKVEDVPQILAELATVQMHAIQTSGNCIRNTTTDHFAGVAPDEIVNPLVWCELIRQWSMLHPEFAFLPRKFKIAVSGAEVDRAAVGVHDIGLQAVSRAGEIGFRFVVGGGMGRTPMVGHLINEFVPWKHLLTYLQATLRVYNLHGRRDNKYKARIKILVRDLTPEVFAEEVRREWEKVKSGPDTLTDYDVTRVERRFTVPDYTQVDVARVARELEDLAASERAFARWMMRNVHQHRVPGYSAVSLSLKKTGVPPGDLTADQMEAVANLADKVGFGELRVSHEQNLVLPDVRQDRLYELWRDLKQIGLATPNVGLLTDIISCPGGDFCSLANAVSIPVAQEIQKRFDDLDYLFDIGDLNLNISGCINSCGHHHVGHIGILGVDKGGEEWYQVTLGGRQSGAGGLKDGGAAIGRVIGRSFSRSEVPDVVEKLVLAYLDRREADAERFVDCVDRLGLDVFREAVYGAGA